MSPQASVGSIQALKDFRAALALYGEDTLAALGAVDAEVRRTTHWLHDDRPYYWQEQVKRRREAVSTARAELFRRKLQKTADNSPAMSEQKENLRRAEAALQDAERRLTLVRKWQPVFQQAVLEYRASVRRIRDLSAGDVPRALNLLSRLIDALEAYLREAPPPGSASPADHPAAFETVATRLLDAASEDATPTPGDADPCLDVDASPPPGPA